MVKLLMSWNIRPGCEDEHFDFFVREFRPELLKMGVQTSDAWYTYYGEHPQMLAGGVAKDLNTLQQVLSSDEWQRLKLRLFTYATDYEQKVIHASGGFQL